MNLLDCLEEQVKKTPDKIIFKEENKSISYLQFQKNAKQIGSMILERNVTKGRIAVYLDKSIACLTAMFGILYSCGMYCVLDTKSPAERTAAILKTMSPQLILTDRKNSENLKSCLGIYSEILLMDDMKEQDIYEIRIQETLAKMIDADPAYMLFTSGSTGVPKGTVVSHRSVINYAESVMEAFDLHAELVMGSQTPFYFSMSVLDIFVTVRAGGTLVIVPKMYFAFPVRLVEFLNAHQVNAIYWVPAAMNIVANRNAFSVILPKYLTKILFAGEVMPVRQLNYWIRYLPDCLFANLYGPTEITDTGTYYIVNRTFQDEESLPIGMPFKNCDVLLLDENDEPAKYKEEGEICFRGSFLGYGYYDDWDKTSRVFCQNPLNTHYPETIYRTGDIGRYNEYGELLYVSRKDFQIKRMGYRIELGEIEANAAAIPQVQNGVCIYDAASEKLGLYYAGSIEEEKVRDSLQKKLAKYMQPDDIFRLDSIPVNANGKYDRILLEKEYKKRRN